MSEYKLPELPAAVTKIGPCMFGGEPSAVTSLYTADQMRDYALAALRQQAGQAEPVARVCHDNKSHIGWNPSVNVARLPEGMPLYTAPPRARVTARPLREYHEDYGPVTWWKFPVDEPSWIGTPLDSDWPGYHTHFTPHPETPLGLNVEVSDD